MIPEIKNIKKVKITVYAKKLYVPEQLFEIYFEKYNCLLINFTLNIGKLL